MAGHKANKSMFRLPPAYMDELMKVGTRGYTENFIFGPPGAEDMLYDRSRIDQEYVPVGLVQSFAKELIGDRIKVNAICPGNFFEGPLWSDPKSGLFVQYLNAGKVPGAQTIEDVKRHYESLVPAGRGCRVEDVIKAIKYVIDQEYETGQAIPVTGGQLMLS